ncbi:hypothetical protein ACP275_01G026200 [Erythranthe tilingii]
MATSFCMRDIYHYARVQGLHTLECIVDTALSLVQKEQIQEAYQVLMLFPRLQPLIAALGWDLLAGKTTMRRKLMQSLCTSKSQALRLEESSPYDNKLDEVKKIYIPCSVTCPIPNMHMNYMSLMLLPLLRVTILVNLGVRNPPSCCMEKTWLTRGMKMLQMIHLSKTLYLKDYQSRVLFGMQYFELMHMRYALESSVLILGAMEKSTTDGTGDQQVALTYLKELKSHLDAITNTSCKIYTVNNVISLSYMDNLQSDLAPSDPLRRPSKSLNAHGGGEADVITHEWGNEMVVSFTGQLLDILRQQLPLSIFDLDNSLDDHISASSKQAVEWRILKEKRFIEDWEWHLSILQSILPISERQWRWKEALTVLRAAPSKLLNLRVVLLVGICSFLHYCSDLGNLYALHAKGKI